MLTFFFCVFLFVLFEEDLLRNTTRAPALQQSCATLLKHQRYSSIAATLRNATRALALQQCCATLLEH
jgi:hypothetical protein